MRVSRDTYGALRQQGRLRDLNVSSPEAHTGQDSFPSARGSYGERRKEQEEQEEGEQGNYHRRISRRQLQDTIKYPPANYAGCQCTPSARPKPGRTHRHQSSRLEPTLATEGDHTYDVRPSQQIRRPADYNYGRIPSPVEKGEETDSGRYCFADRKNRTPSSAPPQLRFQKQSSAAAEDRGKYDELSAPEVGETSLGLERGLDKNTRAHLRMLRREGVDIEGAERRETLKRVEQKRCERREREQRIQTIARHGA